MNSGAFYVNNDTNSCCRNQKTHCTLKESIAGTNIKKKDYHHMSLIDWIIAVVPLSEVPLFAKLDEDKKEDKKSG